jgi:hypothetical protein
MRRPCRDRRHAPHKPRCQLDGIARVRHSYQQPDSECHASDRGESRAGSGTLPDGADEDDADDYDRCSGGGIHTAIIA